MRREPRSSFRQPGVSPNVAGGMVRRAWANVEPLHRTLNEAAAITRAGALLLGAGAAT